MLFSDVVVVEISSSVFSAKGAITFLEEKLFEMVFLYP